MKHEQDILAGLRNADPEAVRAAVDCHGRMVYNVCRRILGDAAESEDAAQTVFILLLNKRATLGPKTILASWLYRAAVFVAGKTLRARLRRKKHEKKAAMRMEHRQRQSREVWDEMKPELDRAIASLPERLRTPIVLAYLEGRPMAEAAAILGLPQRTFYDRLAKALARLQRKLKGRMLTLSPAGFGAELISHALEHATPVTLSAAATQAASSTAAGTAVGTAAVQVILEEVMKAVFWSKTRTLALVVAAGLLSIGVTVPLTLHLSQSHHDDYNASLESGDTGAATAGSAETSPNPATWAALKQRIAALEAENSRLRASLSAAKQTQTQASADQTSAQKDLASLLDELPWDNIGAILAKDALENDSDGYSAEVIAEMLPHLPKLLELQKALGLASIEDMFTDNAVMARLIPVYVRQLSGTELTEAQIAQVRATMRNAQAAHDNLDNEEVPAFAAINMMTTTRRSLEEIIGPQTLSQMVDAGLAGGGLPKWVRPVIWGHSYNMSDVDLSRAISSSWINAYQLDPSTESTLLPIAAQLAAVARNHPREYFGGLDQISPDIIAANGEATAQILRSVPLTPEQRETIRRSLNLSIIFTPPPNP